MPIVDPKVEIEFVAGTWTDVTADVDLSNGIAIKYGRTSEFSDAQTATCDFQLANHLGKYTPKAQLLADGTTAHPYYPNVVPRKRVRVSNSSGNRFVGYIKSWSPLLENGVRPLIAVSANDRQDQLSRINFKTFYEHELAFTSPACSYLLTDTPASAGAAAVFLDSSPNANQPMFQRLAPNTGGTVAFAPGAANPMPQSDGLTGVTLSTTGNGGYAFLTGGATVSPTAFAVGGWATVPIGAVADVGDTAVALTLQSTADSVFGPVYPSSMILLTVAYNTAGSPMTVSTYIMAGTTPVLVGVQVSASVVNDAAPHHYMAIGTVAGGVQSLALYIDGVLSNSATFAAGTAVPLRYVGATFFGGSGLKPVTAGPVAAWSGAVASTVPAALTAAGNGRPGDTSGQRVTRLMQYLGLGAGEYSIDAGVEILSGFQSIRGKSATDACREVATTEGGGSSFYINTDGLARFCGRTFRKPAAPNVTLSAALDLDGAFVPTFDDLTLVNQSTVRRAGGNGFTYTDASSVAQYGLTTDSASSLASLDTAAQSLAQQRVAVQRQPGIRIPQFTVDLLTSSVAASAFAGMQIGWRARINTLPVGVNAMSQVDVIIEGWAETITKTSWSLTFDASPADVPSRFVWSDAAYGRWGPGSTMTLTSSIAAAATSISVTTAAGNPTFTLAAGAYPLPIKIGEEEMTITAAPGSSASPQTLTVTRGTSGTRAAAQTAGAAVALSTAATWTL